MSSLVWLAIPLLALLVAVAWATWAGRPRGPADPLDSVEAHHRFVKALEQSRQREAPPIGDPPTPYRPAQGQPATDPPDRD